MPDKPQPDSSDVNPQKTTPKEQGNIQKAASFFSKIKTGLDVAQTMIRAATHQDPKSYFDLAKKVGKALIKNYSEKKQTSDVKKDNSPKQQPANAKPLQQSIGQSTTQLKGQANSITTTVKTALNAPKNTELKQDKAKSRNLFDKLKNVVKAISGKGNKEASLNKKQEKAQGGSLFDKLKKAVKAIAGKGMKEAGKEASASIDKKQDKAKSGSLVNKFKTAVKAIAGKGMKEASASIDKKQDKAKSGSLVNKFKTAVKAIVGKGIKETGKEVSAPNQKQGKQSFLSKVKSTLSDAKTVAQSLTKKTDGAKLSFNPPQPQANTKGQGQAGSKKPNLNIDSIQNNQDFKKAINVLSKGMQGGYQSLSNALAVSPTKTPAAAMPGAAAGHGK